MKERRQPASRPAALPLNSNRAPRLAPRRAPWLAPLFATALLGGTAAAQAQDEKTLNLRSLAATCANCHGTAGKAVANSAIPGLAGLPAIYLTEQMKAFKAGTRTATVMHQLAKGYSDAQIEQLAAYFAAQPK
jgi:cytochrome subunit of sulfide dehydrogenase